MLPWISCTRGDLAVAPAAEGAGRTMSVEHSATTVRAEERARRDDNGASGGGFTDGGPGVREDP
ncbi:hypothetical protein GCM10012287_33950 [Streptomyces daqingensis]|uniref:Uncharacterized protein n=1 Tax=Streptomyces daqingensis TaxID=1472640 RepID=A0ABQ2MK34_9ACTN|nr:hypothetical protein GCM10012287_33950 [Streptomyces daqingensis]